MWVICDVCYYASGCVARSYKWVHGVVMNVFYALSVTVFRGFNLTKERIVSDNRWLNTLVTIKIALGYTHTFSNSILQFST